MKVANLGMIRKMINAAVLTISDKGSRGERVDSSGEYIVAALRKQGITVGRYEVVPDELDAIAAVIIGGASVAGGVGTVFGTIIGAAIMGVLKNGLVLLSVSAYWQQTVIGVVIIQHIGQMLI